MHHLHIFVVHPSACGLFCGGISSENQCCHGWMYVAPTSARVRSPARSSHMGPIYMSPAGRGFPAGPSIFVNFKYTNTFLSMPLQSGPAHRPPRWSSSLPVSVYSPGPDWLFVYESVRPDKTESDKVMNTNFANQFYLKYNRASLMCVCSQKLYVLLSSKV